MEPVAGTVADAAGTYTIKAPPGTYAPFAFKANYVGDFTTAPVATLGAGATINTNVTLLPASSSISGRFCDATNTSRGLPGIFVVCQSADARLASGFTDSNGNFAVPVTPGQWVIECEDANLYSRGYLRLAEALWHDPTLAGAYNFGPRTDEAAAVGDVIRLARAAYGSGEWRDETDPAAPHEAGRLALEVAHAREALGVAARWSLTEAIFATMRWYRRLHDGASAAALCVDDLDAYERAGADAVVSGPGAP